MIRKHITDLNDWYKLEDKFNWNLFALDTETTALHYDELELVGISLCDGENAYYVERFSPDVLKELLFKLKNLDKPTILMHNSVFDMTVLYKYGVSFDSYELFDTMVAYHLIDENDKKGLKHLAVKFLEADTVAYEEAEKAGELSTMFIEYAQNDAIWTYELAMRFKNEIKNNNQEMLFRKIEMPFQKVLVQMKTTGVTIDTELLKKYDKIIKEEILKLEAQLYEDLNEKYDMQHTLNEGLILKGKYNFSSPQQLSGILFDKLGFEVLEKTPTGMPKTGAKTIKTYKNKHPFVATLEKYKIATQLYGLFIKPLPEFIHNGLIRPNIRDTGTKTGRMSCTEPNIQQLPKPKDYSPVEIRKLFIAPKGYKMFSIDYSGQEVAVAAHVSKDPTLVNSLRKGYDMHLAIANQFYNLGIPLEKLNKTHPEFEELKKKHSKIRGMSKTITFGLMYGKEAYGFSKDFDMSEEEAGKIVEDYFKGMPKLKEAIDKAKKDVKENCYVENLFHRRRNFDKEELIHNAYYLSKAQRQGFNFQIQGFSADMIRAAMVNVYIKNKKMNNDWGLVPIMTVHDESIYIVKEEYLHESIRFVKEVFENTVNLCVPTEAEVSWGGNYAEAK